MTQPASTASTLIRVESAAPYDVVIGSGLAGRLQGLLGESVQRVAFLYAAELAEHAEPVLEELLEHYDVLGLGLPSGEDQKTVAVANDCWEALGEKGFTRSDAVVTFGGGATTDLGGWVAAGWLRGVRVVHMPTTLWLLHPLLTLLVIVGTANHYWLDVMVAA
ncbi:hypothetical protein ACFVJS_21185, partial [Nocardioides sp. NPDC057772]